MGHVNSLVLSIPSTLIYIIPGTELPQFEKHHSNFPKDCPYITLVHLNTFNFECVDFSYQCFHLVIFCFYATSLH